MAEPFRFTTGRWFNRYDAGTQKTAKAPAYTGGFAYEDFAYGGDYPETFTPDAPVQASLICAPQTHLIVIDVDEPGLFGASRAGQLVSWADAISTRGSHFHIGVDMRPLPGTWVTQGRTAWGDVKSNGFVAAPGSVHFTGELYAPAPDWPSKLVAATPELVAALEADKLALAEAKRRAWGLGTGSLRADGAYVYSSGYVRGDWKLIPDGGLCHDDELKDLLWDMGVEYGLPEEECRAEWERLAGALGTPWTERDFRRHWQRVPARRLDREEEQEGWQRAFGLERPADPVTALALEQQQAYEDSRQGPSGFGPPTPPQPDGPCESEDDGIAWFHWYLGTGIFDGGTPTDAGNAEAVLHRARYALRHDDEAGTWLKRVAGRWVQDDDAAKEAVTALGWLLPEGSADPLKDPRWEHLDPEADVWEIIALRRHAKNKERFATSSVVNGIAAMMKNIARARREPWMTVRDSAIDAEPEILWAGGVPWDLKASLLGPVRAARVDRSEPHLHSANCWPDASVDTPLWDELLDAVWPPKILANGTEDRSMQEWAVLVLSAGVTGYPKKALPLLKGGTDRGKSTVIDAIADLLGTYFRPLNSKILDAGASTHDTVLMELKGCRLTFLDEGIQRGKVATARLKRLVGGSSITANRMRQDPVTFRPSHTLAITLNPEENFSFEDPAIDSRIRMLPCVGDPAQVIAVAKKFNYYSSPEWRRERPGVLAKLMAAASVILNDPHALDKDRAPAAVKMAEQMAKDEEDDVLRWFLEATEDCPEGYESRPLYLDFKAWTEATRTDRTPVASETKWGRRMNELIPEDAPDGKPLKTYRNSRMRRRRPMTPGQPGPGGFGSSPVARFMSPQGGGDARPWSTGYDQGSSRSDPGSQPTGPADPPGNPPEALTRSVSLLLECSDSTDSTNQKEEEEKTLSDPLTPTEAPPGNGTGETLRVSGLPEPGSGLPGGSKDDPDENGESPLVRKNPSTPPSPENPRKRISPEERQERDAARKAAKAAERDEARTAKIAELGGRRVPLPAVVLRDQTILEVDAGTASQWLTGMTELSVDVEHTGYPIGHPDYALRLVQLGNEGSAVVFDPHDPAQAAVIRDVIAAATVLHAHSAHADLTPLAHAGLGDREAMWAKMTDTVHLAKLADPDMTESDEAALKPLARSLLGEDYALSWRCDELRREIFRVGGWLTETEFMTPVERSGWAQIPVCESFVRYSASDVLDCAAVARVLGGDGK